MLRKIRVLVIDDSALVRDILEKGLSADPGIEVVGKAADVYIARDKIVFLKPDVLTLDIEMPRMDGVEFLKRLMPQYPLPVVIVSSMTREGSQVTIDALQAGAVDFVLKPSGNLGTSLTGMMNELIEKIKVASSADISKWKKIDYRENAPVKSLKILKGSTDKVIAIGASTGGTVAITKIVQEFPADTPGIVVVQHMPPVFTKMFAESLNKTSRMEIKEAENGDRIIRGRVLIAPGDYHMEVYRSGGRYYVECNQKEKVNLHRPSVDVLFESVAMNAGENSIGIILTGMGRDGAKGLLSIRKSGGMTLAQDEETSVVFGMPREAFLNGGAEKLVPLTDIPSCTIDMLSRMK
jgi:two-component system chemotaxis response regulator CheB